MAGPRVWVARRERDDGMRSGCHAVGMDVRRVHCWGRGSGHKRRGTRCTNRR
ncbi:hypothetical protein BD413DRAFT_545924 [Trametes elegans]|nr:hypothetical protein BD413DRAFT_545924 [Trametes elegans]